MTPRQAASTLGYGAPGTDLDWGGSEQLGARYSYAFEVWDGDRMPWAAAAATSGGRSSGGKGGAGAGAGGSGAGGSGGGDLEESPFERELERDDGQPIYELPAGGATDGATAGDGDGDGDGDGVVVVSDLERIAATRQLTPDELQQLERTPADKLGDSFCRQRWAGPADRAGFEALSNHWLHMSLSAIECGLLDECPTTTNKG